MTPPQPAGNSFLWDRSLRHYRVFGSASPDSFKEKVRFIPEAEHTRITAVFVDVLRATTTLIAVAAAGCNGIYLDQKPKNGPYLFIPPFEEDGGPWVYGGEENGKPVTGQDENGLTSTGVISNSPCSVTRSVFAGKRLRFYSTNGAHALGVVSDLTVASVHALCIANVAVTAKFIERNKLDLLWFVCGGFYGTATLEDMVAAGRVIATMIEAGSLSPADLDDEALIMLKLAQAYPASAAAFGPELQNRQVGRLLTSIGHGLDISVCAAGGGGLEAGLWSAMESTVLSMDATRGKYLVPHRVDDSGPPRKRSTS